ncbi:MAG: hypothetical protein IKB73_07170 [Ruminococcus sp.]|nr:hypothetical protein [Ruminococcus sp.]
MKKIICTLMVAVLILSVGLVSINATTAPAGVAGDTNRDDRVDALDVTLIQRHLAKMESVDYIQFGLGDVDEDKDLTIYDATNIQRYLAKLPTDCTIDVWYNYDMITNDFYSDYESGAAMVCVPVTFTVNAKTGSPVMSYDLYVDDVCVATSHANSITYTFDKAGVYDVKMCINAVFSSGRMVEYDFEVVEPSENAPLKFKTLYLTGTIQWGTITYDVDNMAVHADAIGGHGPYQYKFVFERPERPEYSFNSDKIITTTQDYSEDNVYELEVIDYSDMVDDLTGRAGELLCTLTVYIKDADGTEISREMPIIYTGAVPVG